MDTSLNSNITETTLRDYLRVIFRQKAVIITSIITVMIAVFIGLQLKTPVYESQVKMLISAQKLVETPYYRDLLNTQNMQVALTQSEVVTSNPIMERAIKALGLYQRPLDYEKRYATKLKRQVIKIQMKMIEKDLAGATETQLKGYMFRMALEDLKRNIKVEPVRDTNVFTITASDFSPVGAAIIANVVSRSYVIFDLEQQLVELETKYGAKHLAVQQLKDNIEKMTKSLNGEPLPNVEAIGPASVKIIEQASMPLKPAGISKTSTLLLAFFMSIFLGVMLAFMFEYLDQTFKSPQDVETILNVPFLGSVLKKSRSREYHTLSDQLYLLIKNKSLKSLLFTSALSKEGTTTIVANLAKHMSQTGHKVLAIDVNLRNPALHKALNVLNTCGIADVLEGKASLDKAIQEVNGNLAVLPAGKTSLNPITLLDSPKLAEIINTVKGRYSVVLIDCVNLKSAKDALILSSLVDGIVLVINEGATRRQVVKAFLAPLQEKKANLLGAILNNRVFSIPKVIYDRF